MKVWVMQGIHEGDMFASTHMTEKGAALAAIADVLEFLGVEDKETAISVMNNRWNCDEIDGEQEEPWEWHLKKMRDMKKEQLWEIFKQWSELTWDNTCGYQVEVNKTEITG